MDLTEIPANKNVEPKLGFETLKTFESFGLRVFSEETWDNACQIREVVENSLVFKAGKPVLYAGARRDMVQALAYTNADNFVFIDPAYVDSTQQPSQTDMPDDEITSIGGKIISDSTDGVLGQGGKRTVVFNWGGRDRKVVLYAEDAVTFIPREVLDSEGCGVFMSIGVDVSPTPDAALKHFNSIAMDGFFLGKPDFKKPLEEFGFSEIIKDPSDFSDPDNPQFKGRSLCQKISQPEDLLGVIQEEF